MSEGRVSRVPMDLASVSFSGFGVRCNGHVLVILLITCSMQDWPRGRTGTPNSIEHESADPAAIEWLVEKRHRSEIHPSSAIICIAVLEVEYTSSRGVSTKCKSRSVE